MKKLIFILLLLISLISWIWYSQKIDYNNDTFNCGAKDNICDVGFYCKNAQCIKQ